MDMINKAIKIRSWYGQFGNNLKQLNNAYYLAESNKAKVIYKNHPLLLESKKSNEIIKNGIFFRDNLKITDETRRRISLEYIRPLLGEIVNIKVPSNIIVVHMRSGGSIFGRSPHKGYPQPPLDYYKKIFKHLNITDFSKIWVVCSSQLPQNPMIRELEKLGCTIKQTPIKESISIIANSTTFVSAMSTFSKHLFFIWISSIHK